MATWRWIVEELMPVLSLNTSNGVVQNASGSPTPAARYFFRLTAGMPISFKICPLYESGPGEKLLGFGLADTAFAGVQD